MPWNSEEESVFPGGIPMDSILSSHPPTERLSILLVDDDPRNILTLNAVLDGLGARLVPARSGAAALKALLDEDFALILLDVRMPDMDGFETAALIRQRLRSAHTPIIFVTGNDATPASMHQGYKVGAVDYIVKPLDPEVLRSKVSIFLDLHRKTEEIRRQAEQLRLAEEREHQRRLEETAAAERRRSEAAVRTLLERQALVLASVPLAVYTATAQEPSRVTSVSANVQRLTGYPPEAFTDGSFFWITCVHPADREAVLRCAETVRRDGRGSCEYRWRRADGAWRWFLDQVVLTSDAGGSAEIAGTWLDITDRKASEQALLDAHAELEARIEEKILREEKLNVTFRSIADGVITTNPDGTVRMMSMAAERLTGHLQADVAGRPIDEVLVVIDERTNAPVDLSPAMVRPTAQATGLLRRPDGAERLIQFQAAPIRATGERAQGIVVAFRDITDVRRRDEEVFRASKLESIGVLAGGIAHDFNNLLTGILASVSIADLRAARGQPPGGSLKQAISACERARKLTQQLLTFARGGKPAKTLIDMEAVVTDAATFALQGSRSRANLTAEPGLWAVEADPGQIGQVVQNLVLNADQAMPDGGTVRVVLANRLATDGAGPARTGPYVVVSVSDSGVGITPENLHKIFDPFFTTRPGGSGLGLATVYSIVQQHGGHVEVASPPGEGATFTVWLPAMARIATPEPEPPPGLVSGGSGHILVMDDEPSVRVATQEVLEALGYSVTLTCDGREAVAVYEAALRDGAAFDAVIMDLTVPGGMGGLEATRRIREIAPDVRVLVSSGYSTDPVIASPETYGFRGVLHKPWMIEDLDVALRRVLTAR
jgi:PAS domain S-box-containing protein